jgi:hypothetical protein
MTARIFGMLLVQRLHGTHCCIASGLPDGAAVVEEHISKHPPSHVDLIARKFKYCLIMYNNLSLIIT